MLKRLAVALAVLVPLTWLQAAADTLRIQIVIHNVVSVEEIQLPDVYALHPPYPNPFNPDVNIKVDLPEATQVRVSILNLRGQEVAVLERGDLQAGSYDYQWQGADHPSGLYFVRLQTPGFERVEKISLLK